MKKSDFLTPIGFIAGISVIVLSSISGDSSIKQFISIPSMGIVLGGIIAAMMISYSFKDLSTAIKAFIKSFQIDLMSKNEIINTFKNITNKARRQGILSIQRDVEEIDDPFMKKGLELIVDGLDEDYIKEIMELEIYQMQVRHQVSINVFRTAGSYSPAFGMLGTVIGLIQMLANLESSDQIAVGMAVALITTLYGSILANIIFIPIASNLSSKSDAQVAEKEMILEGIMSIQKGKSVRYIEEQLLTFLNQKERLNYLSQKTTLGESENE